MYRQVLYGDDSLIVVGDLLEYPDSYLCMTRTVYEEMGLEALGSGSDRRDDYVEMTQISVYRIAEQNQAELSHSQDYYQAGWYRTASMAEDGTLYTATDKNIYGAEGSTEYLTEVIPVVGSQTEMNYLDSSRIYVDRYSTELDSYAVISSLDLSQPAECMETVAYLGEQMPVVRIADDGVYLGCTIAGEQGDYSRMLRFDGQDLSVVTASEDLGGLLIPQSFVSLPDTGCAVLIDQQNGTGRGISECAVLVLDWGLGTVATVPVAISPDEILWVEVSNQIMLVRTVSQIYQIDLSTPLSPEVSVSGLSFFGFVIKKAPRERRLLLYMARGRESGERAAVRGEAGVEGADLIKAHPVPLCGGFPIGIPQRNNQADFLPLRKSQQFLQLFSVADRAHDTAPQADISCCQAEGLDGSSQVILEHSKFLHSSPVEGIGAFGQVVDYCNQHRGLPGMEIAFKQWVADVAGCPVFELGVVQHQKPPWLAVQRRRSQSGCIQTIQDVLPAHRVCSELTGGATAFHAGTKFHDSSLP